MSKVQFIIQWKKQVLVFLLIAMVYIKKCMLSEAVAILYQA